LATNPNSPFISTCWLALAKKWRLSRNQGKSLDEIVAAKPTAATDEKWGNGFGRPKDFIGDVFQGVSVFAERPKNVEKVWFLGDSRHGGREE